MSNQTITAEELDKFTISNTREIAFYLHQLINDGERISVVFDGGHENVLTVLLDIDENAGTLIFDWGGSEESNQKLLRSERNYFVCAPHGVKNQFSTGKVSETTYKKRRAFMTRLPQQYTRLQRRECFRLILPMTRRPSCMIRPESGPVLNFTVVDISVSGVAIELPGTHLPYEIGQTIARARIELKTIGTLDVDLEVRNTALTQRGGKPVARLGCNFVKLSHAMENQLQRFITDVQREERARLGN